MKRAWIVTDLGFGDAGKGTITDYLVREHGATQVVRHNGGAQAAHNVVTDDGRHHTFAQFGSGTFVPGVETYLSRYMMVNPFNAFPEEEHLRSIGVEDAFDRLTVDPMAPLITPWHRTANRMREMARGLARHGSCGQGVGETMADLLDGAAMVAGDLKRPVDDIRTILTAMQYRKYEQMVPIANAHGSDPDILAAFEELYDADLMEQTVLAFSRFGERVRIDTPALHDSVVFEGAQGVLLDEWKGFHPHTTWSTTTSANALRLLEGEDHAVDRVGVLRAYTTRHGEGPFVTEDEGLNMPEPYNGKGRFQGDFRVGWLDLVAHRYAVRANGGVGYLALTHADTIGGHPFKVCDAYEHKTVGQFGNLTVSGRPDLDFQYGLTNLVWGCKPVYTEFEADDDLVGVVENALGEGVGIVSYGPRASDKVDLR